MSKKNNRLSFIFEFVKFSPFLIIYFICKFSFFEYLLGGSFCKTSKGKHIGKYKDKFDHF